MSNCIYFLENKFPLNNQVLETALALDYLNQNN
jgi:hypothetical protein